MNIRSDIWVGAFVRHLQTKNASVYLAQRGHESAGVIFIHANDHPNGSKLYGPVPWGQDSAITILERRFALLLEAEETEVTLRLKKEADFDQDLWVIDVEMNGQDLSHLF